tara:strand:- start:14258 stop:15277 length:1020 start_codon:yes stop_codon:yes gene_type:complete
MIIFNPKDKIIYQQYEHSSEESFEKIVVALSLEIFGRESIYVDIKKRVKGGDIITIPDGYLIDLADPENPNLYVIENEIVSHDPFKHIGIQLLKFATSFDEGKVTIRNFLMEEISKNEASLKKLEKACSNSSYRNIDNYLDSAVYREFKAIVVIDEAREELYNVLEKIRASISVIELKTFQNDSGDFFYQFNSLYEELGEDVVTEKRPSNSSADAMERKRNRRAKCDTVVVPAREEGFKKVFLGENRWYAIRIGAAMKDKIKYIASYEKSPISAITYVAKVKEIRPYKDTGKYEVIFEAPAEKIEPIKLQDSNMSPQGPVYIEYEKIKNSKNLDELLKY